MHYYLRALWWGLLGATLMPVLLFCAGYLLCAMAMALAVCCIIGFPVVAVFFPKTLLRACGLLDEFE